MIKRAVLDKIPTHARDDIIAYLVQCVDIAERNHADACAAFVQSLDETQRANALQSAGEATAFKTLYTIFNNRPSGGNDAKQEQG